MRPPCSEETKIKISKSLKGIPKSKETRDKISKSQKGRKKPMSLETRMKISLSHRGEKHYNWKGGVTSINRKIRSGIEYRLWREAVFKRDDWTCIWCGQRGGKLNADHIKPFSVFPELRFAIDNGRTLCEPCHRTTDTFGRKAESYPKEDLTDKI